MNAKRMIHWGLLLAVPLMQSCETLWPVEPEENHLLDGPMEGLSGTQLAQFHRGDEAFGEVFTSDLGLGPLFVANQCSSCHVGDGKGHPFVGFTRFGQSDTSGNQMLHLGGPQLQHKSLPGFQPEQLPSGASNSYLIAPAVTGLGFLDAVSDADLVALADPNDLDGDGISGKPHWVDLPSYAALRPNALLRNGRGIGRFGKKGAAYDLLHQTVNAYSQDMGITSLFEPMDLASGLEIDAEVAANVVHDVVAYLRMLKAPIARNQDDTDVKAGKQLFVSIQCEACHTEELHTSYSPIAALSNQTFHPYTDQLLHDMGSGLDDGYTEGYAETAEWKTPALWGMGLSVNAQGGNIYLMHDGRATSIEEAIVAHGGEAEVSKLNYQQLSLLEQDQLIAFLMSL